MNIPKTLSNCPVCDSTQVEPFTTLARLPVFLFPVPADVVGRITRQDFHLTLCGACGHLFQGVQDPELLTRIYEDLYRHYQLDVSNEFAGVYLGKFREFFQSHGKGRSLLDIDCGEAPLGGFFQSLGFAYSAIEPSPKHAKATANNPGADIRKDTFRPGVFDRKFDVVLLNFVLEHLFDLGEALSLLRDEYLEPGGRLFITVPNVATYLRDGIQFYAHEHAQFFTPNTLHHALETRGFTVVAERSAGEPAIWVCAENQVTGRPSDEGLEQDLALKRQFLAQQQVMASEAREALASERHVVLYGAGLPAFWLAEAVLKENPNREVDLVDDNPAYQGRHVAILDKPIRRLSDLVFTGVPFIVISTSAPYQDAIEEKIRRVHPHARIARIRGGRFELRPAVPRSGNDQIR